MDVSQMLNRINLSDSSLYHLQVKEPVPSVAGRLFNFSLIISAGAASIYYVYVHHPDTIHNLLTKIRPQTSLGVSLM